MARRNTGDKKVAGKRDRAARGEENIRVQADHYSIAFDQLNVDGDVRGDIRIGHTIGYTAEQVSVLLKQITTTLQPKKFDGRCPYKGLEVFEEEDAELFFGRERLVNELVGRVKESRTVFITGPSGSGKSSLVRAGLIHDLKQGAIKSSERWLYETMKPGREPLQDLALAFSRLKSPELQDYFLTHIAETEILNKCAESVLSSRKDQRFVLFVDQFEEVFTQINSEEERVAFINMLAHAGTIENGRVIVLFAMRSDFVSNCATYPALNELLSQEFRQIGAMQPEELVSAIALPARHVGLPVEHELIAQIINDMKGEPDALPLMQFALKDLFDAKQAEGGVIALTLKDYLGHGGIHKSLERHADATFAKLSESEQELTRSIFSGLIEIGRGTQDTKRTALFDELIPANTKPEEVSIIVQKLADARLIITDEQAGKDTVTISHEKLIEAWPWLKKLVNENRDAIALQNEIASDAKEWDDHNRDESYLYSGARLANVCEQLGAKRIVLSDLSQIFVDTSQEAQEAEQRQEEQRRQKELDDAHRLAELEAKRAEIEKQRAEEQTRSATNLRKRSIYLTGALVAALIAVGVAVFFSVQSQKQTKIAHARELATQAILQRDKDFALSLLLGVESFRTLDLPITRGVLLDNAISHPQLNQYLFGHSGSVSSVAFSPDGTMLASVSVEADYTIILWDVETHQPIGEPLRGHSGSVSSVAFSPDGTMLASGSWDHTIILWDVETHQPIGEPLRGYSGSVSSVAFSPDGTMLASGNEDNTITLWDVETHQPIGEPLGVHVDSPFNEIYSVAFSPDGTMLASGSGDNTIILWGVETHQPIGEPLRGHSGFVNSVAFSPDGTMLASSNDDNAIILWDVETHQPIGEPLRGHSGDVSSIAFSSDGTTLASGSQDNTIILWDVETHQPIGEPLIGHMWPIRSVAFSSEGKTLASGSDDNTIILWDVETHQPIGEPLRENNYFTDSVAFSPDGTMLASGSDDNTIILWDMETHQSIGEPLRGHNNSVSSVAFSPDGTMLASSGGWDKTIILWDVKTHQPIEQPLKGHSDAVWSVAFSPDGKILVSGSRDKTIILWDVETHQPIGEPLGAHVDSPFNEIYSVAFSPDGKILVSGSGDNTIILWDVETHQPIGQPLKGHSDAVWSVAFSPDGTTLASGSRDKTIILWGVETHQPIREPLRGHNGDVSSMAFSPDGTMLASGSWDNTIILWDVETHQPIGEPLRRHSGNVSSVAFSPDGTTLASGNSDGKIRDITLILWDLDPRSWIEKSCQRAGRNLTRAEWAQYFANEDYRKTCEQWPLEPEVSATPSPIP